MLRIFDHKNAEGDYRRAKELRKQSPIAEKLLWNALCKLPKQKGLKFRRQYPLHPYIADFVCLNARLVIELDGPSHDTRLNQDKRRDAFMENEGFDILRFSNDEVMKNLEGVVLTILMKAHELIVRNSEDQFKRMAPSPDPSREGRGIL